MKAILAGWLSILLCGVLAGAAAGEASRFELEIRDRRVDRAENVIRVQKGEQVTLSWRSDEPVSLHVHGYDIEAVVEPGRPTELTFQAHATGRFPITSHGFGGDSHGHATLIYLEVHPE